MNERTALCQRLAETQHKRGRPMSAEYWEAATREVEGTAETLRRFTEQGGWRQDPDKGDATGRR